MYRPLIALLAAATLASSSSAADRIKFSLPLNVATEAAKIQANYAKARAQAQGNSTATQRTIIDRNEALLQLVGAAEAAKSSEHRELANIDFLLSRFDAAAREARAAIKADKADYAAHALLVQSLCRTKKLDDAQVALRQALSPEVGESAIGVFLLHLPAANASVVSLLLSNHKYPEAGQAIDEWQSKLDKLKPKNEQVQATLERTNKLVALLRSRIEISRKQEALVGQPYFPITDATWLNGAPLKPEQLRGKVVLIDFWAIWCGPCIATFPHLREWHDKYGSQGLVVIGATTRYGYGWNAEDQHIERSEKPLEPAQEDAATAQFLNHHEVKHRIAVLKDRDLSQKYIVSGIPHAVLIDKQGVIRLIRVGSSEQNVHDLEAAIRRALGLTAETASN